MIEHIQSGGSLNASDVDERSIQLAPEQESVSELAMIKNRAHGSNSDSMSDHSSHASNDQDCDVSDFDIEEFRAQGQSRVDIWDDV